MSDSEGDRQVSRKRSENPNSKAMQDGTIPDRQLLEAHVDRRDEAAFAQLVRRHVNLVFGTAFRILGDRTAAEEVAQNVFVTLARKAASIRAGEGLAGWLHRAAVLEAVVFLPFSTDPSRGVVAVQDGDELWCSLVDGATPVRCRIIETLSEDEGGFLVRVQR